jgi:hypothetical protein
LNALRNEAALASRDERRRCRWRHGRSGSGPRCYCARWARRRSRRAGTTAARSRSSISILHGDPWGRCQAGVDHRPALPGQYGRQPAPHRAAPDGYQARRRRNAKRCSAALGPPREFVDRAGAVRPTSATFAKDHAFPRACKVQQSRRETCMRSKRCTWVMRPFSWRLSAMPSGRHPAPGTLAISAARPRLPASRRRREPPHVLPQCA